jgi:predicted dehydrogenase
MSNQRRVSRRAFLKKAGSGIAAAGIAPMFIPSSAFGANDRVNLAIVGIRGRGGSHINAFGPLDNVHIKTIVDVDRNLFGDRTKEINEKFGYQPATEQDMRRVLDDPDIDGVTLATPNHWHALGSIWAAQAGKHVYVEKPSSHGVWEGRQMVNAARKHDVVMQVGFQNRSRVNTRAAMDLLHGGGIGKVYLCRGLCYRNRPNIGLYPDGPMGEGENFALTVGSRSYLGPYTPEYLANVDYDLWVGPAAMKPFNRNRFHYNWHWQWEYGNGDTGNQGPHQFDVGRWGLNKHEYPVRVSSLGGLFGEPSAQDTPNVQTTILEYGDGTLFEFSTRGMPTNSESGIGVGNIFLGTEGRLEIDAGGNWKTFMGPRSQPGPNSEDLESVEVDPNDPLGGGDQRHFGNFVQAIRAGSSQALTCDIEEGHRSSVLAHIGNIAYRLKRELKFDDRTERFVNDDEANALLRRTDRAPYLVPEIST